MIGPRSGIWNAVSIQERTGANPRENLDSIVLEEFKHIRPKQDLVEQVPEVHRASRTPAVIGPGRTRRTISEVIPHWVVEEIPSVVVDPP